MASPTQWTWVWVNSGSWWWTGRPGMLQFMGSQRVGLDWLNWTGYSWYVALAVKNPPANAGDIRDTGSVPGFRRSSGEGHGNLPQYSCLENPMDGGAWWVMVHRAAKSQTEATYHAHEESKWKIIQEKKNEWDNGKMKRWEMEKDDYLGF